METEGREKAARVLGIYTKLMNGSLVNKAAEAAYYNTSERSIQRDIDDIRNYLENVDDNDGLINNVVYDRTLKGYRLEKIYDVKLTNPEILAICKILLDSRSLRKDEMDGLLKKLIECCVPEDNRKLVNELIMNEKFHYIQPKHGKRFLDIMWQIGMAIQEKRVVSFYYKGLKNENKVLRYVEPVAIMFSEFYFYVLGFVEDKDSGESYINIDGANPTIYRIDRLEGLSVTNSHFSVRYKNRFEEGEFRKRAQFMFSGKLKTVEFIYKGYSIEAVEDRLPTAKCVKQNDGSYKVVAEAYGDGIDHWLRQQGEFVEVISPKNM